MSDDLYDPYESGSGGKPGKPVVSWKKADVGDSVTGIVVPPDAILAPTKGYRVTQEYDNDAKEKRYWAPRGYQRDGALYRGPITESQYIAHVGSLDGARAVTRSEVTLVTDLRNTEFMSGNAKQRLQENGETDDGIRRVIMDGQSIREAHLAALEAIGADRPQPGQRWTVTLASQTPNDKQGHTNGFTVKIEAPTPETGKVVAAYIEAQKSAIAAGDDPYTGGGKPAQTDEPPF